MKTIAFSALALALTSLYSMPSYAVEGGTALNWNEHPYLIESDCTGTIFAGKYALLAGHCGASVSNPFPRTVNLSNGENMMPTSRNGEPFDNDSGIWGGGVDVAIWTLPSTAPMDKVAFLADLNTVNPTLNDDVSFIGFGQDDSTPRLGQADNTIINQTSQAFVYGDPIAHSVPGDSGAPLFNDNNKIIGVNYSSTGSINPSSGLYTQNAIDLRVTKDWILQSINRWHSATELKFTGDMTIDVQSLHKNDVSLAARWNNGILTTGDVTVTGGTCMTTKTIEPYGMCTLELSSAGGEGKVMLEDGNDITVNRVEVVEPVEPPTSGGDSGGGSMGWLSVLGLLTIARLRKKNKQ
ncbi:trypsin-like serine protease [Photobacterium indicum]|uniref:trypsin-like serine protease n=1 Tax=Photobacterium indicum TaxID=81447 RepID=UPI003D0AFC0F